MNKQLTIVPIGTARVDEEQGSYRILVDEKYRPALEQLDQFTHVNILWWADRCDTPGHRAITRVEHLPSFYGPDAPPMGIFATRSESRPNPIALSSLKLVKVDEESGIIDLAYFDALDGTPVLDIKPYLPMTDLITSAGYPDYLQHWPASNEEAEAWWAAQFAGVDE